MWWKREAPAAAPPEQPSVFECVRHPSSCTGPNAIRADQLPFLHLWPLFLAAGCLVAAILWNMYAVPAPAPKAKPPRRPKMPQGNPKQAHDPAEPSAMIKMHAYSGYAFLIARGVVLDLLEGVFSLLRLRRAAAGASGGPISAPKAGPPIWTGWVIFYTRRLYQRIEDCWNRPITGEASSRINVCVRKRAGRGDAAPLQMTGETQRCLNLGSYNYLGFGGVDERCTPAVDRTLREHGVSGCSSRLECGETPVHVALERTVATFLDKPAALVVGMGFATNSTIIPVIVDPAGNGKGVLVLSDALNHASIVEGVRGSGCKVQPFLHNDMEHLEALLQHATEYGQPSGRPWRKIIIMVEGIYSMEGVFCRLREIVALKKKYRAYLYLDEAHSIGAVGPRGRGVTDLLEVPTSDVDVMMGTFTKSFGSVGGYIAASEELVATLRRHAAGSLYAPAMSPPAVQQALSALHVIMGTEEGAGTDLGQRKIRQLRANSNRFREGLVKMGCRVLGDIDSPIIPIMLYHPEKICAFSRACLRRGLATVVVGYPATPLLLSRARFCIAASHTAEDLDFALKMVEEAAIEVGVLYDRRPAHKAIASGAELDVEAKTRQKELRGASMEAAPATPWAPEPLSGGTRGHALGAPDAALAQMAAAAGTTAATPSAELRRTDFVRMSVDPAPRAAASAALQKYGCGTCGPRGFYGTLDVHLTLEQQLAAFLGTESAIIYSFGIATISSVVPAFVRKGDLLYMDAGVSFCAAVGSTLSRGAARTFAHNDCAALEAQLRAQAQADLALPPSKRPRRFILVEGLYANDGSLADLPSLLRLRDAYGCYLIVDETLSFGALGATGRGLAEHYGVPPSAIDVLVGSLEHALGSVGGFCAGSRQVVSHQRLSGAGYCFSASLPAYATCAALEALKLLDAEPARVERLGAASAALHTALQARLGKGKVPLVEAFSDASSPLAHVRLTASAAEHLGATELEALLHAAADEARRAEGGAAAQLMRHSAQAHVLPPIAASLRLAVHSDVDPAALDAAAEQLAAALEKRTRPLAAALKAASIEGDAAASVEKPLLKAGAMSRSASLASMASDASDMLIDADGAPLDAAGGLAKPGGGGAGGEAPVPVTVPLLAMLELVRQMIRRYIRQQTEWHELTVMPAIQRLRSTRSAALHALFSIGHFFGSESFYFLAVPLLCWSNAEQLLNGLNMPMFVTFFVVNLYVGNFFKNLFALPRPKPAVGGPTENDFGWPSMYAINAVGLPFFAVRYWWGGVGTGTPLSAHYQLATAASYTLACLWVVCVCGARLYSGVSSPADVQGGMLVGGVLVRLWLPICDTANAWIVKPDAQLWGLPQWLVLLLVGATMLLVHPFTPNEPRSWTALAYSAKAIAFGTSFILGSNACLNAYHCDAGADDVPTPRSLVPLVLLVRNLVGFALLGVAWLAAKRASARLEVPLRQLLPKQPLAPVMLRNAVTFGALGATISLGAPLALKNIGL